jgi:hypothetical protein
LFPFQALQIGHAPKLSEIPSQHFKDFGEGIYSPSLRSRTDG